MFLIDAAAQNAYSLSKIQNTEPTDMLRDRQKQIEILAFDLIKYNVKEQYETSIKSNFRGRRLGLINKLEEFMKIVNIF